MSCHKCLQVTAVKFGVQFFAQDNPQKSCTILDLLSNWKFDFLDKYQVVCKLYFMFFALQQTSLVGKFTLIQTFDIDLWI